MFRDTFTAMLQLAQNHPTFVVLIVSITALLLGLAVDRWYNRRLDAQLEALRSRTIADSERQEELRRAANRNAPWHG